MRKSKLIEFNKKAGKLYKKEVKNIEEAKCLLKEHGYHYALYMPDFNCDDQEIAIAILTLTKHGYVVLNKHGNPSGVIGTINKDSQHMDSLSRLSIVL